MLFSCLLDHNGSVKGNFIRTTNVTVAELARRS